MNPTPGMKIFLIVAGSIGIAVGGGGLFAPITFHATAGITLSQDANLLSEMRAAGGTLLTGGILILLGAFISRLTFSSFLIAAILYLSYGFSRALSMAIDGQPSGALMVILVMEIMIGLVAATFLLRVGDNRA